MTTTIDNNNARVNSYGATADTGEFANMSLEDIMFAVFSGKASAQTEEIKNFAATVKHNTLRATNLSNIKAALDAASEPLTKGDETADLSKVTVNYQNEDGTHVEKTLAEAMEAVGFSSADDFSGSMSKADIEKVSTELDNQHSALEGQQQIDMAKLNKMFTDVQTSWNLVNGGIKSFGGLGKSFAQSLSQ